MGALGPGRVVARPRTRALALHEPPGPRSSRRPGCGWRGGPAARRVATAAAGRPLARGSGRGAGLSRGAGRWATPVIRVRGQEYAAARVICDQIGQVSRGELCPSPSGSRPCCALRRTATRPLPSTGRPVGDVLGQVAADYPRVREQVFTADGSLHRFLNVYVNDDDVRYTGGLDDGRRGGRRDHPPARRRRGRLPSGTVRLGARAHRRHAHGRRERPQPERVGADLDEARGQEPRGLGEGPRRPLARRRRRG